MQISTTTQTKNNIVDILYILRYRKSCKTLNPRKMQMTRYIQEQL